MAVDITTANATLPARKSSDATNVGKLVGHSEVPLPVQGRESPSPKLLLDKTDTPSCSALANERKIHNVTAMGLGTGIGQKR